MSTPTPNIKCIGANWWSTLLTIAIILVRAFQNNAEPMSQWSIKSWIWMTLPIWGTTAIAVIVMLLFIILWIWANVRSNY